MWRRMAVVAALALAWPALVAAQTASPTPSPTATLTPTATPSPTATPIVGGLLPVGSIVAGSSWSAVDPGWTACDGREVVRTDYPRLNALYEADGYPFGAGNGVSTFNLPNCKGRNLIGVDSIGGLPLAQIGGARTHTLTIAEIPPHSHRWSFGGTGTTQGLSFSNIRATNVPLNTTSEGGGQPHNIMDPYVVVAYWIWTGEVELEVGANVEFPATPTPLPPYVVYSTVVPAGSGEGQAWATEYSISAGDVLISALLFVTIVVNVGVAVLLLRKPTR
ncbi:MAG: tail fiber protein [Anaerolineae bacterium]|nr:tail fiber protein [Anaerolineae bacterium]